MPLFNKWKEDGATWGIWHVTETPEELQSYLTLLSCDPVELAQFKCTSRQLEYLAVRVLVRVLTGCEYRISHHESGKPYFVNSPMKITISHTKGYVAVGLHDTKEVGIDIEYVSDRVLKVTSRFVRPDESHGLTNLSDDTQLYVYLLAWSAKETMFKVLNTPAVDFLEHLHVSKFTLQTAGVFIGHEYKTPKKQTYAIHYQTHPEFVLTYLTV